MSSQPDAISKFRDEYLDFLEGHRDEPPTIDNLPAEERGAARAFVDSITAARGIDPYASSPSIEQLLSSGDRMSNGGEFGNALQAHLRRTVDATAEVAPDVASAAMGLDSTLVVLARGMRIRVVPEASSAGLDSALVSRAEAIAAVFSAFPDTHAVLYATEGPATRAVILDRGDIYGAIETPSGQRRAPRPRRPVTDANTACERWLAGLIPEFQPLSPDLLDATIAPESVFNPYLLATRVVDEVSAAGIRARIEAKRATWRSFGVEEAQRLAAMLEEAQVGRLSPEDYESFLDDLVGTAA